MGQEIRRAESLVNELVSLYGDALVSVVLYGSAARGEYREGVSDLNLLVLLRTVDPAVLRRGSGAARRWTKDGNPPPLLLSAEEWRRSADVFPIEAADIRDAYRVLHGADPFEGMRIDPEHLRLQCEHELKGKQIQLREHYLLGAEDPEQLGRLLHASVSTFLVLFRTVLRLMDTPVPRDAERVVRTVAERAGFTPDPVLRVLESRGAGTPLRVAADDPVVVGYMDAVSRVAEFVDRLATGSR